VIETGNQEKEDKKKKTREKRDAKKEDWCLT
jgi:hypothetical protein